MLQKDFNLTLETPRKGESATSPGKLFPCSLTPSAGKLPLTSRWNLSNLTFQSLGLVPPLAAELNSPSHDQRSCPCVSAQVQ